MKLLFCANCQSVQNMSTEYVTYCECNRCSGRYHEDGVHATVEGPKGFVYCLGFANGTLVSAIVAQRKHGNLPADFGYCGELVSPGREFKAFVIPDNVPTCKYIYHENP